MPSASALSRSGTRLLELDGVASGYILTHPWRFKALPALNALLGAIPADADTFYVHDLALLPAARGTGAAAMIVGEMLRHARGCRLRQHAALSPSTAPCPSGTSMASAPLTAPELDEQAESYEAAARYMTKPLV